MNVNSETTATLVPDVPVAGTDAITGKVRSNSTSSDDGGFDDCVILNASVRLAHRQFPSARAEEVAAEALKAAQRYYKLFYTAAAGEKCKGAITTTTTTTTTTQQPGAESIGDATSGACAGKLTSRIVANGPSSAADGGEPSGSGAGGAAVGRHQQWMESSLYHDGADDVEEDEEEESSEGEDSNSSARSMDSFGSTMLLLHSPTNAKARQGSSSSQTFPAVDPALPAQPACAPCEKGFPVVVPVSATAENSDEPATGSVGSPVTVQDTYYHTFYPPVLHLSSRKKVIAEVLHHPPRPYHSWHWRKATRLAPKGTAHASPATSTGASSAGEEGSASTGAAADNSHRADDSSRDGGGPLGRPARRPVHTASTHAGRHDRRSSDFLSKVLHFFLRQSPSASGVVDTDGPNDGASNNNNNNSNDTNIAVANNSSNSTSVPSNQQEPEHAYNADVVGLSVAWEQPQDSQFMMPTSLTGPSYFDKKKKISQCPSTADTAELLGTNPDDRRDRRSNASRASSPAKGDDAGGEGDDASTTTGCEEEGERGAVANASLISIDALAENCNNRVNNDLMRLRHEEKQAAKRAAGRAVARPLRRMPVVVDDEDSSLCIVMVGLPARGKTFLAQKICRLLNWHGVRAKVLNVQVAWRSLLLEWEAKHSAAAGAGAGAASTPLETNEAERKTHAKHRLLGPQGSNLPTPLDATATATPVVSIPASLQSHGSGGSGGGGGGDLFSPTHTGLTSVLEQDRQRHRLGDSSAFSTSAAATATASFASAPGSPGDGLTGMPAGTASSEAHLPCPSMSAEPEPTAGAHGSGAAPQLRFDHFEALVRDPQSPARRVYRYVLDRFARDTEHFFRHQGGEVVLINDDFVTTELREEALKRFGPRCAQLVFMEVVRDAELNKKFDAFKVRDPSEYPKGGFSLRQARSDFERRSHFLTSVYEPVGSKKRRPREQYSSSGSSANPDSLTHASVVGHEDTVGSTTAKDSHSSNANTNDNDKPTEGAEHAFGHIRIVNSSIIESNQVRGVLANRIVGYAMNMAQQKVQHPIYLVRHGESCYNLEDRIGGDPLLTSQGLRDAAALLEFLASLKTHLNHVESSHIRRAAQHEKHAQQQQKQQQASSSSSRTAPATAGEDQSKSALGATTTDSGLVEGGSKNDSRSSTMALPSQPQRLENTAEGYNYCITSSISGVPSARSSPVQAALTAPRPAPATGTAAALAGGPGGKAGDAHHTLAGSPHGDLLGHSNATKLELWTSQLRRAIQTAELSERLLNIRTLRWSSLNEIHGGICEGMTYKDVDRLYPSISTFRKQNKYTFRYPEGESYQDLVQRLEPVIMELENADRVVVVVAHQAVLRCLLGYYSGASAEATVSVEVPHRTVWRCTYNTKGIATLEELLLDNYEVGFDSASDSSSSSFASPPPGEDEGPA